MSSNPSNSNLCQATRRDGNPCTAPATRDEKWCVGHDPNLEEIRQAARAKGGRHTSNAERAAKLLPARLRPLVDKLEEAINQVHAGTLAPAKGTAMAALSNALVRVFQCGELEERLRRLEGDK